MNPLQQFYNQNSITNDYKLSAELGVNEATVWRWRADKTRPRHEHLAALHSRYNIPVSAWYEYWQAKK